MGREARATADREKEYEELVDDLCKDVWQITQDYSYTTGKQALIDRIVEFLKDAQPKQQMITITDSGNGGGGSDH